jgi:hypothetical protein
VETAVNDAVPRATIRNPVETDEQQMVELLFKAFQSWPAFELDVPPLVHLRWKMRSDPIAARHQWITEIDGRTVAMVLRIIRRVRARGRDYRIRDGVDAAVDPRYREGGLYSAMLDHARTSPQASEFAFAYSTNPRAQRRSRREKRRFLANPIQVLERPYHARAVVARRREKYAGRLPAPLAVLRIKLETASDTVRIGAA